MKPTQLPREVSREVNGTRNACVAGPGNNVGSLCILDYCNAIGPLIVVSFVVELNNEGLCAACFW